jgi:hypothetical protein
MQTRGDSRPDAARAVHLTPRHRRILAALVEGKRTREEVDTLAGASNGPDEVLRLRRTYGLSVPCERIDSRDRDNRSVQVGVYSLTQRDRREALRLLASSSASGNSKKGGTA